MECDGENGLFGAGGELGGAGEVVPRSSRPRREPVQLRHDPPLFGKWGERYLDFPDIGEVEAGDGCPKPHGVILTDSGRRAQEMHHVSSVEQPLVGPDLDMMIV